MAEPSSDTTIRINDKGQVIIDSPELARQLETARAAGTTQVRREADTNYVCPTNLYCPPKST